MHLASHGIVDNGRPLASAIALSPGKGEDGKLTAGEVLALRIPVELVVLSACRTGRGASRRGDGPAALGRIFQAAGARATLVSFWRVSDRSTASLMSTFYRAWMTDERGKAEALRRARVSLIRSRRWAAPYYWNAFELQGDG